ncbi:hypothetical protein EXS62_01920 [Candidatus Kaiserbacteria bacterium]|nr:hypothetical protein [Candidatus Kaiserbacteria bacterium]
MKNTRTVVLILVVIAVAVGVVWYMNKDTAVAPTSDQAGQGAAVANSNSKNITIATNPAVVAKGGRAQLVWSTVGFNTCSINGPTLDSKVISPVQGSIDTGVLSATSNYTLSCQTKAGKVESKTISVIVR